MNPERGYRISELLGKGSFGHVYLADTVGTGIERRVAVKVLRPEQASVPGLLERLRDEARMLALIRHRAIVRVDDLVELDGCWAIVMEYVEGCDVGELLREGPLPPRVALAIAEEIANALHVAGSQEGPDGRPLRLVHRDVKPSNIRVTAQGEVKLLDFGVARAEFSDREARGTTVVFGTPTYMAPERFRGEDTQAGDVYALGVTLWEMLLGEPPGLGPMEPDRTPPGAAMAAQWKWLEEISPPLYELCVAMMAPAPDARPGARDVARTLSRIRAQLGGMTLEDWAERVVAVAKNRRAGLTDERSGSILRERSTQRRRREKPASGAWVWAGGALGVTAVGSIALLVAAAGGWWWWTQRGRAPASPAAATSSPATAPAAAPPSPDPSPRSAGRGEGAAPTAAPPTPDPSPRAAGSGEAAAVAPATAPAPAPPEARSPKPEASASKPPSRTAKADTTFTGICALEGDAIAVTLTGRAGIFAAGELPIGQYTAEITLSDGNLVTVPDVTINNEKVTRLVCKGRACTEVEGF